VKYLIFLLLLVSCKYLVVENKPPKINRVIGKCSHEASLHWDSVRGADSYTVYWGCSRCSVTSLEDRDCDIGLYENHVTTETGYNIPTDEDECRRYQIAVKSNQNGHQSELSEILYCSTDGEGYWNEAPTGGHTEKIKDRSFDYFDGVMFFTDEPIRQLRWECNTGTNYVDFYKISATRLNDPEHLTTFQLGVTDKCNEYVDFDVTPLLVGRYRINILACNELGCSGFGYSDDNTAKVCIGGRPCEAKAWCMQILLAVPGNVKIE